MRLDRSQILSRWSWHTSWRYKLFHSHRNVYLLPDRWSRTPVPEVPVVETAPYFNAAGPVLHNLLPQLPPDVRRLQLPEVHQLPPLPQR